MQDKIEELMSNAGISGNPVNGTIDSLSTGLEDISGDSDITDAIQQASQEITQLQSATTTSTDTVGANTDALSQVTQLESDSSAGGGETSSISQIASGLFGNSGDSLTSGNGLISSGVSGVLGGGILGGGLLGGGLGALFSGISSLFGGGPSTPPPLTDYVPPEAQNFSLASSGGTLSDNVDDQYGQPRSASITEQALSALQPATASSDSSGQGPSNGLAQPTGGNQQITVQVQAMDSQSFLDRSSDIAEAVRQAMLNMHSINDVVNDL